MSGSCDKTVKLWDAGSGTVLQTLEGHSDDVASVALSPDGKRVVSGSVDKTVKVRAALQTRKGCSFILLWSSGSMPLSLKGAKIGGTIGLSEANRNLFVQKGAELER